jgi:hypothetical protein
VLLLLMMMMLQVFFHRRRLAVAAAPAAAETVQWLGPLAQASHQSQPLRQRALSSSMMLPSAVRR